MPQRKAAAALNAVYAQLDSPGERLADPCGPLLLGLGHQPFVIRLRGEQTVHVCGNDAAVDRSVGDAVLPAKEDVAAVIEETRRVLEPDGLGSGLRQRTGRLETPIGRYVMYRTDRKVDR